MTIAGTYQPRCSKCGAVASTVILTELTPDSYRFEFDSIGGGSKRTITKEQAAVYARAFSEPYSVEAMRAADLHDNGGMCLECGKFYCAGHWYGDYQCPEGHERSVMDPHWYPPEVDHQYLRDRWPGGWGDSKDRE